MELEMAGPANVGAEPLSPRPDATLVTEGIEPEPRRQMRRRPPDGSSCEQMGDDDPDGAHSPAMTSIGTPSQLEAGRVALTWRSSGGGGISSGFAAIDN